MNEKEEDLMLIREILSREIDTINTYQRMLRDAKSEEVASFLSHVIDEEKEHVAEALELIKQYDPVQARLLESLNQHWRAPAIESHETLQPDVPRSDYREKAEKANLTVGSLRGNGRQ